ncbi:hypothetical protein HMI54_007684 [Coelomomyces lativittatus]|nr:hypothetical protein HMI54_007684 [Coelomomyces lativittatus]
MALSQREEKDTTHPTHQHFRNNGLGVDLLLQSSSLVKQLESFSTFSLSTLETEEIQPPILMKFLFPSPMNPSTSFNLHQDNQGTKKLEHSTTCASLQFTMLASILPWVKLNHQPCLSTHLSLSEKQGHHQVTLLDHLTLHFLWYPLTVSLRDPISSSSSSSTTALLPTPEFRRKLKDLGDRYGWTWDDEKGFKVVETYAHLVYCTWQQHTTLTRPEKIVLFDWLLNLPHSLWLPSFVFIPFSGPLPTFPSLQEVTQAHPMTTPSSLMDPHPRTPNPPQDLLFLTETWGGPPTCPVTEKRNPVHLKKRPRGLASLDRVPCDLKNHPGYVHAWKDPRTVIHPTRVQTRPGHPPCHGGPNFKRFGLHGVPWIPNLVDVAPIHVDVAQEGGGW